MRAGVLATASAALLLVGPACTGAIDAGHPSDDGQNAMAPRPGDKPASAAPGGNRPDEAGPVAASDGHVLACSANKTCEGEDGPLRRLTNREYLNTVRDLLGTTSDPTEAFVEDSVVDGFNNNARTQYATEPVVRQYHLAARALADEAQPNVRTLVACDVAAMGEAGCARLFIDQMGKRAFRRPLLAREKEVFAALYEKVKAAGAAHDEAAATVLQGMLSSPQFYYRIELTGRFDGTGKPGEVVRLNDWEIASRLSYLFLQSMPDAELFAAAEGGRLRSPEQIAAQAGRLLASTRGREVVGEFFLQWYNVQAFEDVEKDAAVFPEFTPALKARLLTELRGFLDHAFWEKKGHPRALIAGPVAFRDRTLATFYRDGLGSTDALGPVDLSGTRRRGLLATGVMASTLGTKDDSDPVKRGMFMRETLLCGHIPEPPPDIGEPPPHDPKQTKREHFQIHTNVPGCDACHRLMDPMGLGLETYDGVGRWRDTEKGKPIDTSGRWPTEDGGGSFKDSAEMLETLSQKPQVFDCAVRTWFRFALGRSEIERDLPTLTRLYDRFKTGGDMHALLADLVQTPAFTHRLVQD